MNSKRINYKIYKNNYYNINNKKLLEQIKMKI